MRVGIEVANEIEFRSSLEAFFGRPIEIGERARDALVNFVSLRRIWNRDLAIRGHLEIFSRLVAVSPAAGQALLGAGFDLSVLPCISDIRSVTTTSSGYALLSERGTGLERLLPLLFSDPWSGDSSLSPGGIVVRDSGLLTETDLLAAYLSSAQIALKPNPVAAELLSQIGLIDFGLVSPEGEALLDRADSALRRIGYIDPAHYQYQYVLFLDNAGQLRVRPFGAGHAGHLLETRAPDGVFSFRSGLVQPVDGSDSFSEAAIEELEALMRSTATKELDYQRLFERNPRLLSGLEFGRVFPHPILHKDDGSTLIPDFFLEKLDLRGHAILDLKVSSGKLAIRKRNRTFFAQWVQEAIAQLRFYRDWFEVRQNREEFMKALGLDDAVFRPRIVLVGGRTTDFEDEVDRLRLLSGQEGNFELWTYDDLLDRARRYRQFVKGP